jgi:hypothetical protein
MQDDDTNNGGLENLQPTGSGEMAGGGSRLNHSLALQQENDGKSGFDGIVQTDYEQIAQGRSEVQRHLLSTPFEEFFQRDDREEAHWPKDIDPISE